MKRWACWVLVLLLACASGVDRLERMAGTATVDGARIAAADREPGNWLAHGRTYSEQRYSPLEGINADNVINGMSVP